MSSLVIAKRVMWLGFALGPFAVAMMGQTKPSAPVSFSQDIMPLMRAHCVSCHGGAQPAGKLDLSSAKGMQKGGASGPLVVPGKPDKSILVKRLLGQGGLPQMPMGFAPFTKVQIDKVKAWIAAGASYAEKGKSGHWAYLPLTRPVVPTVKNKTWGRNAIDAFILEKIEKNGLAPAKEASKEALLRRVTLDLTGLPPTLEELDAFLKDKSPNAYEKVVDRLLASPHYGERQARVWLDLARYADTNGYEKDTSRVAWKYRDWVIDAFNRNMPYDRFTIEQLAGDLLPNATLDDQIATGFHRNSMLNLEGGVDPEEGRYEMINDRVATTSTVWLGQTLQCSRCHDHKYDPFTQKDYFKMYAAFAYTDYEPRGDANIGEMKYFEPSIEAPSPDQVQQRERLKAELATAQKTYAADSAALASEREAWEKAIATTPPWRVVLPTDVDGGGATVRPQDDNSVIVDGPNPDQPHYTVGIARPQTVTAIRIEAMPLKGLPSDGPGRSSGGNFILTGVDANFGGQAIKFTSAMADYSQETYSAAAVLDSDPATGWAVYPEVGKPHEIVLVLEKPVQIAEGQKLSVTLRHDSKAWPKHAFGHFRVSTVNAATPEALMVPADIRGIVQSAARTGKMEMRVDTYFRSICRTLAATRKQRDDLQNALNILQRQIPTAMVMREKPVKGPLTTQVHIRGEFLQKGETVAAGVPALFASTAPSGDMNRLSLAKWLVNPKNPLTARVQVNRMWEQYFGVGLVETSENFGTQGTPPTHPALLDWLASEFERQNWNMKAIHRLIVTSATYRQDSGATAKLIAKDPKNALYARGPRFRMEAEMIRDNALAVAGLLDAKIGGPSVYPYQPEGVWDSPYNGERWMTSDGGNMHRRGLYTFWKRTAPYPMYLNFDATSREECTVRRIRTNTPIQALNMLNDEAFLQAAKALALRAEKLSATTSGRVGIAFRLCTGRRPTAAEQTRLEGLYRKLLNKYTANPDEAKKLAATPSDAAWTMVANVLLNLDETITKG